MSEPVASRPVTARARRARRNFVMRGLSGVRLRQTVSCTPPTFVTQNVAVSLDS